MKKTNKKRGFTIIELVIVIAVIAILAGVLIPTFSSVIEKANKSNRLQTAREALVVALATQKDGALDNGTIIVVGEYYYTYTDGQLGEEVKGSATTTNMVAMKKGTTSTTLASNATEYLNADMLKDVVVYISATDFAQIDGLEITATSNP